MGLIAAVYGLICYAVFLGSFLYAIAFVGDLVVPKMIDSPPSIDWPEALAINLVLLGLFAVQHSVMARQGFKAVWTRIVPPAVERSTYVLISSLLLGLICWKWQAIPTVVWDARSPVLKALLLTLFALGWLILLFSTFMINHFDLFGLRQVYLRLRGQEYIDRRCDFRGTGAGYKFVRHPIWSGICNRVPNLAATLATACPLGHLWFSIATTGYILIGIFFEERDLMKYHAVEYGEYRTRVPMLLPTGVKRERLG